MATEITHFELLLEKKLQWKLLGEFFGNISQCLQQEVSDTDENAVGRYPPNLYYLHTNICGLENLQKLGFSYISCIWFHFIATTALWYNTSVGSCKTLWFTPIYCIKIAFTSLENFTLLLWCELELWVNEAWICFFSFESELK